MSPIEKKKDHLEVFSVYARKLLGVGDDWQAYKFEVVGMNNDYFKVTGAVPSGIYTSGEWKGYPIWTAEDKKTKKSIKFKESDFRAFEAEWKKNNI